MAEAARYWGITYAWATEQINKGWNQDNFPTKARKDYKMNCWHCGHELTWGGDHDIDKDQTSSLGSIAW